MSDRENEEGQPHVAPSSHQATPEQPPPLPPGAEQIFFALQASIRTEIAQWASPIPPPEIMERYESILPGSTNRILKMAEDQSAHRIDIEKTVLGADSRRADKGLYVGGLIGALGMVAMIVGLATGHSLAPLAAGLGTLAALVGVYIYGTENRRHEREDRVKTMTSPQVEAPHGPSGPGKE